MVATASHLVRSIRTGLSVSVVAIVSVFALAFALSIAPVQRASADPLGDPPADPPETSFDFAVVPDTQNEVMTDGTPLLTGRYQWLSDNKDALNLKFIEQIGDLVNWGVADPVQFTRASLATNILDNSGVPYGYTIGNHDGAAVQVGGGAAPGNVRDNLRNTTVFNQFFPVSRFKNVEGTFEPNKVDNMFQTFVAGGVNWLVLTHEMWPRETVIQWMEGVVASHPTYNVIVSTHAYTNQAGDLPTTGNYGDQNALVEWQEFISQYANIKFVISGHYGASTQPVINAGYSYSEQIGVHGNKVAQIMTAYHSNVQNHVRLLHIDTVAGTISSSIYVNNSLNPAYPTGYISDGASNFVTTGMSWIQPDGSSSLPIPTAPSAPGAVSAVAGNASATVSFTAPNSDGGAPITSYTVTSSPDGLTATSSTSPITVNGLTNGTAYTFSVQATNIVGTGPPAATDTSVTPQVPVVSPVLATDTFGRSVTNGWGSATTGGAWTPAGTTSRYGVAGGVGTMTLTSGNSSTEATLGFVQSTSTSLQADVWLGRASGTGGLNIFATPRRIDARNGYIAKLFLSSTNTLRLSLTKKLNNVETNIGPSLVLPSSLTYAAGKKFTIKTVADGLAPTTLKVKVWVVGTAEPDWQLVATDSTAALQVPGAVSFSNYLTPTSALAPVTLSVDNVLATRVDTTPPPPNTPPVAGIGVPTIAGATVAVSGATSTDSDGTISAYAWTFGDGSTATGVTASHSYTNSGTYSIGLTVTDNAGATATATTSVTITVPPPANVLPVARIATPVVTGRSVDVSGLTSSDADGTIVGYSWTFGDGGTATSGTATHLYSADGTFPVTLTVTDNAGATAIAATSVTVSTSASLDLARDTFGRTVAGGWGQADLGGAWSVAGTASRYSVGGGVGSMPSLAPGGSGEAWLGSVSSTSTDLRADLTFNRSASGGTYYAYIEQRRVDLKNNYETTFQVGSNGKIGLSISSTVNATAVVIGRATLPASFVYSAGQKYLIAVQAVGTNPTILKAKTWLAGTPEPDWQITVQDSKAALQKAGAIGFSTYQSGSSTLTDWKMTVDNLVAVKLG